MTVVVNLHSAVSPAGGWRDQCLIDLAPLGSDVVKLRPRPRTQVSKTDPWTKTSSVTGGGNLKLLFPSITVYFVDRPDIDAANPGSFDALGSGEVVRWALGPGQIQIYQLSWSMR